MHRRLVRLVAQTDAAEDDRARDYQLRSLRIRFHLGLHGLVFDAAENGQGSIDDGPIVRHAHFQAAANYVHIDHRLLNGHACAPKVEFRSAEGCDRLAAAKIRRTDSTLAATEYGECVTARAGIDGPGSPRAKIGR